MWTIASASSAQLCHIRDPIYECTRRRLESLEAQDAGPGCADIECVQAWILLLIYEFMRINHQRGWISAGRCFRLVQLIRLHEINSPENVTKRQSAAESEDWVKTEIKRRTFWVAYSLDRFISTRHGWPLTLNEQDVRLSTSVNRTPFHHCALIAEGRYLPGSLLPRRPSKGAKAWRWDSCPKESR